MFNVKLFYLSTALLLISFGQIFWGFTTEEFLNEDVAMLRNSREGNIFLLNTLSNELVKNPDSYDLNWEYSAILYFQGDIYENEISKKKEYFLKTKNYAQNAVRLNPSGIDGHFWLATGYGKWSEVNGILNSLFCVGIVRDEMTKVIEIKTNFFRGLPWAIRARAYNFAPGWPISIGNKAQSYFDITNALQFGSDYRYIHQLYAEMLINDGKYKEAEEVIVKALELAFEERIPREEEKTISGLKKDMELIKKKFHNP